MDLCRAFFDCTADDLLVAKLHAYDLSEDAVKFVYSYLKRRKQGVKVNDTESFFQIILTGRYTRRFCIRPHYIQYVHK